MTCRVACGTAVDNWDTLDSDLHDHVMTQGPSTLGHVGACAWLCAIIPRKGVRVKSQTTHEEASAEAHRPEREFIHSGLEVFGSTSVPATVVDKQERGLSSPVNRGQMPRSCQGH